MRTAPTPSESLATAATDEPEIAPQAEAALPGDRGAPRHRGAGSTLRCDATAVALTVLACYYAFVRPAEAYLILLTAVAANMWYLGRARALPLTLGTIGLVALLSPDSAAPRLRQVVKDVPHVVLFIAIVFLIGAATETLRRARSDAERHAAETRRLNVGLQQQMEKVQSLSQALHEANESLAGALAVAERTAEQARELQRVTAALSVATSVADVGQVVLTQGLRAVQASRGCLLIAGDAQARLVVAAAGHAPADVTAAPDAACDGDSPLGEAMRWQRPVRISRTRDDGGPLPRPGAGRASERELLTHLALPLVHGEDLVGGLAFDFAETEALGATDALFTELLAQATADALWRARTHDAEREARRAAELTSRAREEVLGVVAHDLRNPLHLVGSTAELLMEPTLSAERREAVFAISLRAVQRMNRLVGDLLDVVRMDTGRLALDIGDCDVRRVLREGVEPFLARATEAGVAMEVVEGPEVGIQADEARLLQVIDNLVGNALKFTPAGGRIVVSSGVEGEQVRVAVSDTGPGIPEEQRVRLFDRFWQARGTDRRGIGLGLTIAKGIVEAHGGRLWVESTPGRGSTFQFTIPISGVRT